MNTHIKILLVEDNPGDIRMIREMLLDIEGTGFETESVNTLAEGLKRLSEVEFDALLLDLGLPDSNGMGTLTKVISQYPELPVIVLTGLADAQAGVRAVHQGAQDYLTKGEISSNLLNRSIRYAIERKRLLTEMRNLSLRDHLTGLYNRRGFFALAEQRFKVARRENTRLLFIIADLDGLKAINDTYGHELGDNAIRDAADILKDTFRESDIIGRIGGDEFAIVVAENVPESAETVTARLGDKIDEFKKEHLRHYQLSISIGIGHCDPASSCSIDAILAKADKLMYQQKQEKNKTPLTKKHDTRSSSKKNSLNTTDG
jgi:two-component system cell cycle response regulator